MPACHLPTVWTTEYWKHQNLACVKSLLDNYPVCYSVLLGYTSTGTWPYTAYWSKLFQMGKKREIGQPRPGNYWRHYLECVWHFVAEVRDSHTQAMMKFHIVAIWSARWWNIFTCFSVRGCPSSLSGSSGSFSSPNYPRDYDNNLRCSWGITVPSGYLVKVTFGSFKVENRWDYLRIYDGPSSSSAQLAVLTGPRSTPFVYLSTGTRLWFTFHTDHSVVEPGFHATYTAGKYKHRPAGLSLFRFILVSG